MEGKIVVRSGISGATVKQTTVSGIEFRFIRKFRECSPFLVNGHQVTGTFVENCRSGEAVGKESKECQLFIRVEEIRAGHSKNAVLNILLTKILKIDDPIHNRRNYTWEFVVLGVLVDGIGLFPEICLTDKDYDDIILEELPERAWGLPREVALQLLCVPSEKLESVLDYLESISLEDD